MVVVVVVVAFCACVVLAVDILDMVVYEVPVESFVVCNDVNRTAAHGNLSC